MKLSVFYAAAVSLVAVVSVDCRIPVRPAIPQLVNTVERSNDVKWSDIKNACIKNYKYKSVVGVPIESCKELCEADEGCKSISYKLSGRICRFSKIGSGSNHYHQPCYIDGYEYTEILPDITCGRVNRIKKIVGGVEMEMREYPWQVVVSGMGYCGGSLINDRWVLTAAYCTDGGLPLMVTLGDLLIDETETAEITFSVKRIVDHPDYCKSNQDVGGIWDYNFSLLELETTLDLASIGPHISPVCLPNAANPSQYDDVTAVVSGMGKPSYGGSTSNVLLEATAKTMTNTQCNQVYEYGGAIMDSMICAAAVEKDSCQGDYGGSLVTDVGGYYNLIGVVSFGWMGCADPEYPGVYARVTHVIDWITSTTSQTERSAYLN